jgi:hypothetical protein
MKSFGVFPALAVLLLQQVGALAIEPVKNEDMSAWFADK